MFYLCIFPLVYCVIECCKDLTEFHFFLLRCANSIAMFYIINQALCIFFRGYNQKKLTENIECEIFQTILEEAKESYQPEIVHELQNNTLEDFELNINQIEQWVDQWRTTNIKR